MMSHESADKSNGTVYWNRVENKLFSHALNPKMQYGNEVNTGREGKGGGRKSPFNWASSSLEEEESADSSEDDKVDNKVNNEEYKKTISIELSPKKPKK